MNDLPSQQVIQLMHELREHAGWHYLKNWLGELQKQAHESIFVEPISAVPTYNEAEVKRREYLYLEQLMHAPEDFIKQLAQQKKNPALELDPQELPTTITPPSEDDPFEEPVRPAAPSPVF